MTYEKNGLYVDEAHLEAFAENYARGLRPDAKRKARQEAAGLRRALAELRIIREGWERDSQDRPSVPGAAQWLLDNEYLARSEGNLAVAELSGSGALRCSGGAVIVLMACDAVIRSGLGALEEKRLKLFLTGFQKELPLEREELAVLSAGLRRALILRLEALFSSLADREAWKEAEAEAGRCFNSLRWLSTAELRALLDEEDHVEQILRRDPSGIYPRMSDHSRSYYRARLSAAARNAGLQEVRAAQRVLTLAESGCGPQGHVGWWILRQPLGAAEKKRGGGLYIGANILLTTVCSLLLAFLTRSAAAFFFLLIPVSELVKAALDFLLLRVTPPVHVPRLALERGVPREGRTLCVISVLLTEHSSGNALASKLEECFHLCRNAGEELRYALLADFPDSDAPDSPEQQELLSHTAEAVESLNRIYGGGFYLLTRSRVKNADGRWSGWERKRGALLETMRLLRGESSAVTVSAGVAGELEGTRYLLVLDSDTRPSPGSARELIGAALHPLNRAVIERKSGTVTQGYGILAPRIGTELGASRSTDFARIFAPQGGVDPYDCACSELYMDRWGRGGFAGKGLIDIDAYLACMGSRVPDNLMLSHDAVEGAFLRTGFVGEVEFTDGWPGKLLPYFSRLERWTRGDWQNLCWLFSRGRTLPDLERWKLFDSLRRSLSAPGFVAAFSAAFLLPGVGPAAAAAVAMLALLREMLSAVTEVLLRSGYEKERFHSVLFTGIGGGIVRTFLRLLLLPAEAWTECAAIVRSVWRMAVSKKRLLEWRTAAQTERGGGGLARFYQKLWFAPALGALLVFAAPSIIAKTSGLLWLLTPLCACLLSLPAAPEKQLSSEEQAWLRGCAGDTWTYFERFLSPEDHWLPPDNYQARPAVGLARRTSPTNIGLALLSLLAAADLRLLAPKLAMDRIAAMLSTLEKLPKWKGHLYNWYSTQTLAPLSPRYVSTVDSGNLCACLIALAAGLDEYGRRELSERARKLSAAMRFEPLFDPKRKLFYIGIDPQRQTPSRSWYDLMSSEARLTSYLAVARGDVPAEHWRRLSRALLASGRFRGMASWTGTMFEYLMPELLLPLERDSSLYETANFCLYVQKKRGRRLERPWGVSESAFGALDASMNYRYKAHGCAGLALCRGMDEEYVVSPYSAFLALSVRPRDAIRNLKGLEARGMRDEFGFWEALDYTTSRLYSASPARVRCVMAHHQGMSLVACANALLDGVMRRRFLADPAMGAYTALLQEKIPVGAPVLRRDTVRTAREKAPATPGTRWESKGTGTDFLRPRCCLLAGEDYQMLISETGLTRALWGAVSPYVPPDSPLDREKGIDLFLESEEERMPLLPDASLRSVEYAWHFSTEKARITASGGRFKAETEILVNAEGIGERRVVRIRNLSQEEKSVKVTLRLRPLLATYKDYVNHPAFYGLGVSARTENGCLLLRRLARGANRPLWLCLAPSRPCVFSLSPSPDRERYCKEAAAGQEERFLNDPLVTAACSLVLPQESESEVRFALACEYSAGAALRSALHALTEQASAGLVQSAAAVVGMLPEEIGAAFSLLPRLCFPTAPLRGRKRDALWRWGISGDLPLVVASFDAESQLDHARKLMDMHLFLSGCGAEFDLVFLSHDAPGYQKPLQNALGNLLWRQGGELLRDRKGGVHILEAGSETEALRDCAAVCLDCSAPLKLPRRQTEWRRSTEAFLLHPDSLRPPRYQWKENGMFTFYADGLLPPRQWQQMLSNASFGTIALDCGCGGMWYGNARENQLVPWLSRMHETEGVEALTLESGAYRKSVFAAPGSAAAVSFLPGAAIWETRPEGATLRVAAFVPPDVDARVLLVSCDRPLPDAVLHWSLRLQLAGSRDAARYCEIAQGGGFFAAKNPQAMEGARPFLAMTTNGFRQWTFDRAAALAGQYDGKPHSGEPVFAAAVPFSHAAVLVCGCDAPERMLELTSPTAAERALEDTVRYWQNRLSGFSLRSPELSLDRLCNGWLAYQAIACRLLGRCSIYQSGGAFGFRDQLQDAVNLILLDPSAAREQILRCCGRQYLEGDVQHWWHEGDGLPRGVRTGCSDDLLWLPWAVAEYEEKTGDSTLCAEKRPWLRSAPLGPGEKDRYEAPGATEVRDTVLTHACRAIEHVMARGVGPHGLLWIGSGDWNDGFDRVGGESVWLSWFFLWVADRFCALMKDRGIDTRELREFSDRLAASCDRAWDGAWYLRGWYQNGAPLGSSESSECKIDVIAQSFAVLSGRSDHAKAQIALTSAVDLLYDRENHLIRLFTPAFSGREHPGYIESYGPGFRENGGQYTHGALWLVMALLRAGRQDTAWELLRALLPAAKDTERYQTEPFVLSADVYTAAGHEGEGGWSWYTGAAGWMLRIVTEDLLGIRLRGGKLFIEPRLPSSWSGYSASVRGCRIEVNGKRITVDGREYHRSGYTLYRQSP